MQRSLFILKYWLYWIIIFQGYRILFFFFNKAKALEVGRGDIFRSMFHGMRMDASMAAYFTVPVILLMLLGLFLKLFSKPGIIKFYTAVLLFLSLLLSIIDANAFAAWGFRLDASVLKYLNNPKEAWASVSNLPVFWLILVFFILWWVIVRVFKRLIDKSFVRFAETKKWQAGLLLFLLLGASIIPIRGGLQLAPLNQSSVYFSDNNFINQSALNAQWNFIFSLLQQKDNGKNPFQYLEEPVAAKTVQALLADKGNYSSIIDSTKTPKPNIIFIVWESFTAKVIGYSKNGQQIVPGFEKLIKQGIYFDSAYATGDRTDKGIVAVLSGYPAQPTTSIVKYPTKAAKLPVISKVLQAAGYNTAFYYGGELEFANMKAYLLGGMYGSYTSINDFDKKDQNSKWGAHDGVVANKLMADLANAKSPFFYTWLTLSSHEPFEIPKASLLPGDDDETKFLNSLHYSDKVVADFITFCQKQPWWGNTIVVITGDHGHRFPAAKIQADNFRIPILLLGGALTKTDTTLHNTVSQIDIPYSVLQQLRLPADSFYWSKSLFNANNSWAYAAYNNGFAFFEPGRHFFFDNVGKRPSETYGNTDSILMKKGKALQQQTFSDYISK